MNTKRLGHGLIAAFVVTGALVLTGCMVEVPPGETKVYTLFSAQGAQKADVPLDGIDSFVVTVTEIVLDRVGGDDTKGEDNLLCTLTLDEAQEVPTPDPLTGATGVATFTLLGNGNIELRVEHDVANPVGAHIHSGAPGVAGPVVIDLGDPASPIVAELTPAEYNGVVEDHYINVHSEANAAGQIRADIDCPEVETDPDAGGQVTIFSGAVDVDLVDLTDVSVLLSEADVPAGDYTKARLSIENPRLVLSDDPDTVRTDVRTTANGRLFVSEMFTLPEGQASLITLDLSGLKLVELGNGSFNLTPQLDVNLSIIPAAVLVEGTITALDADAETITLTLTDGETTVMVENADIFLVGDVDVPTGVLADLTNGLVVLVEGTLTVDGTVVATSVTVVDVAA